MSSNQENREGILHLQQEGDNSDTINGNQRHPERIVGNPRDTLCGRGFHILHHHGNLELHLLVNKYRQSYQQSRRHEKPRIRTIIRETKRTDARFLKRVTGTYGARFLKRVTGTGDERWVAITSSVDYGRIATLIRHSGIINHRSSTTPIIDTFSTSRSTTRGFTSWFGADDRRIYFVRSRAPTKGAINAVQHETTNSTQPIPWTL
jgi:hypothetical protein